MGVLTGVCTDEFAQKGVHRGRAWMGVHGEAGMDEFAQRGARGWVCTDGCSGRGTHR